MTFWGQVKLFLLLAAVVSVFGKFFSVTTLQVKRIYPAIKHPEYVKMLYLLFIAFLISMAEFNLTGGGEQFLLSQAMHPDTHILWIVGMTNALNLIDGLDGLAAGVCGIGCASMLAVSLFLPQATEISVLVAALGGACLGFLPFNINPAKIFMGDSGSLLLGYVLSTASVLGLFKMYTLVAFAVPVLTLALPLTDTVFAVVRRVSRGESPFHADRGHIHHRLLALGLTQKQAVAVLYAASGILGAAAVLLAANAAKRFWLLLGAVALALGIWLYVFAGHHFPSDPSVKAPKKDKKEDGSTKP